MLEYQVRVDTRTHVHAGLFVGSVLTVYSQYICIYSSLVYAAFAVLSFTAFCRDHSCIHMRTHTHAHTHTHTHTCAEGGGWDLLRAAQHFLIAFRSGRLGRVTLDSLPMPPPQQHSD